MPDMPCALCHQRLQLCDSHYMPKCFYNSARHKGGADEIAAPVLGNMIDGVAKFTNSQVTKKLLCTNCEGLFDRQGERTICAETKKHDRFVFRDDRMAGHTRTDNLSIEHFPDLDWKSYAYFAMSIVWRGSVTTWPGNHGSITGTLKEYEEPIRKYLLGLSSFPKNFYIRVYVNTEDNVGTGFGFPFYETLRVNKRPAFRYEFNAPGLYFSVFHNKYFVGRERAKYHVSPYPISFRKRDFMKWEGYRSLLFPVVDLKRKGKLGREFKM